VNAYPAQVRSHWSNAGLLDCGPFRIAGGELAVRGFKQAAQDAEGLAAKAVAGAGGSMRSTFNIPVG